METIGEVTYKKEGCFKWSIQNFREMWGKHKCFHSPYFIYTSQKYYFTVQKGPKKDVILWLYSVHPTSPSLFLQLQLCTDSIISNNEIYDITLHKGISCCKVVIDLADFLSEEFDTSRHDCLIVLFWDRKQNGSGVLPSVFQNVTEEPKEPFFAPEEKIDPQYESLKKLQEDMQKIFLNKERCDIKLQVQGIEFPAHRYILRARSPVFSVMFNHKMKEANSGVVVIEDSDPKTFQDFLRFLYTGDTKHISLNNVCELYVIADKYQVLDLKARCTEFMKCNINVETFCDFFLLAHLHNEEELISLGVDFFCKHTKKIINNETWEFLLQENWTIGNKVLLEAHSRGKNISKT